MKNELQKAIEILENAYDLAENINEKTIISNIILDLTEIL